MWKDSIRNIVVIFQTTILRIVGFYVRDSALDLVTYVIQMYCKRGENLSICERMKKVCQR